MFSLCALHRRILSWLFFVTAAIAAENQYGTFYVDGRFLYDPCGDRVIIRGANAMIVFWDRAGARNYPELARTGANCCRIFWMTGHAPEPVMPAADLDKTLQNCWANRMIPMPGLWDATGKWDSLDACVNYWLRPDVLDVLKKHQKHLLLNIANEAGSGVQTDFVTKYVSIVKKCRAAGIHCPLVIDADRWGREWQSVVEKGPDILAQDPDRNLIFSWHNWDPSTYKNGTRASIKNAVDQSIEENICFVFGEFGPCEQCGNCSGTKIEWEYMIEYAQQKSIGWLSWVWRWNDCHAMVTMTNDTYGNWANPPWGESIARSSLYSIEKTSVRSGYVKNGSCTATGVRAQQAGRGAGNAPRVAPKGWEAEWYDTRGRSSSACDRYDQSERDIRVRVRRDKTGTTLRAQVHGVR